MFSLCYSWGTIADLQCCTYERGSSAEQVLGRPVEPEQHADCQRVSAAVHQVGHFRNDGTVDLSWNAILCLLLAQRGSLYLLGQLQYVYCL